MKKLLCLILIALLITLAVFIALQGFSVGELEVLSYEGLKEKSEQLDNKIQEASKLVEKDFKQAVSAVNESSKKLEQTKLQYDEMATISSESDIQEANQIQKYEVETLWVKLGNYATREGVIIKMDIINGSSAAKDTYNLKFTVNGSYISITDFISDIENDTTLGFKIEEFKLVPNGDSLQGTFICKDIVIESISQTTIERKENLEDSDNPVNSENDNSGNTTTQNNTNNTNNTNQNTNSTGGNTNNTTKDNSSVNKTGN